MAAVIIPYPLSLLFAGKSKHRRQFLVVAALPATEPQPALLPDHRPLAIGPLVVVAACRSLAAAPPAILAGDAAALAGSSCPASFFELWPVKGFQYLLPIAPAVAILAARTLALCSLTVSGGLRCSAARRLARCGLSRRRSSRSRWRARLGPDRSRRPRGKFLAGSGGVPGGREAGAWIDTNVPEGASMLAIGPSMANIVQFYGHRKAYGLSVSPNPLQRNPSYEPVVNPDLQIRQNDLQYLVWDSTPPSGRAFFARQAADATPTVQRPRRPHRDDRRWHG